MDSATARKRYRPIFKNLKIGTKEYAVLDMALAHEKALHALSLAIEMIEQNRDDSFSQHLINQHLTTACDFGNKDAAFLLASRALNCASEFTYPAEDAVVFLKLAAERGHAEAAYELGCCYAAMGKFISAEQSCTKYFNSIDPRERQRLAEHYFHIAVAEGHQDAIEDIVIAYAYGRGYIAKDISKFIDICENLIEKENQSVALGYGAWLLGMTVEGGEPLAEAIKMQKNPAKGLDCLLMASRGKQLELAQHALHLVCIGMLRDLWEIKRSDKFAKRLHKDVAQGNQLLALYFAWYSIPVDQRVALPTLMTHYQLSSLASFVQQDEKLAIQFLDHAFFGTNSQISQLAKDILQEIFGQYFLDEALTPVDA
ncbi:MAG: hypothetical protein CMF49_02355 [Legionellales bacterium]|nr:hypothetical protein [Legionellales bacterium]